MNQQGKEVEQIALNPAIFSSPINRRLLDLVLVAYAGNKRRGLADTKTRREIRGGGKKPWRQKGTGNARQGSIRAPQWRGGGTVFGPQPRSYRTELPEKMKQAALISAFSQKNKESNLTILNELKLEKPKTKELAAVIKNIKKENARVLCLVENFDKKLQLASRNLRERFKIESARQVNAYDVLRRKNLVIVKEALELLEKRILGR
ncbi:MAG: 50S ribosomal protein L4 [Candidatus Omnitrophica bacterium]|nr:50S ribosomal protein L4 [Candidatus Omnitrophota bacterium]